MKIFDLDKSVHKYASKTNIKKTTVMLYGNCIRSTVIDDRWTYCLQDILAVTEPVKNAGWHVAEWLRRSAWLDDSIYRIDAQTHYADWATCCRLADAFMYVYRNGLAARYRVEYDNTGRYDNFSTPCKTKCSDAAPYKLWRALLEAVPDINITPKSGKPSLSSLLDFAKRPEVLTKARKPKVYDKPDSVKKLHTPALTKQDVEKVSSDIVQKKPTDSATVTPKAPDPVVSLNAVEKATTALSQLTSGAGSLVAALVSGKKLRIEISLEG